MADNNQIPTNPLMELMSTVADIMSDINETETANYNNSRGSQMQLTPMRMNNPQPAEYTPVTPIDNDCSGMRCMSAPVMQMNNQPMGLPQMAVINTPYGPMLLPVGTQPPMGVMSPVMGMHPGMVPPMMNQHPPLMGAGMINSGPMNASVMNALTNNAPHPLLDTSSTRISPKAMSDVHDTLHHINELQSLISGVQQRFAMVASSGGQVPNVAGVGLVTDGHIEDITNAMRRLYNLLKHGVMNYR